MADQEAAEDAQRVQPRTVDSFHMNEPDFFKGTVEKLSPSFMGGWQSRKFVISRKKGKNGVQPQIQYYKEDELKGTIFTPDLDELQVNEGKLEAKIKVKFEDKNEISLRFENIESIKDFRAAFRAAFESKKVTTTQ